VNQHSRFLIPAFFGISFAFSGRSFAQQISPDAVYQALRTDSVWVHPSAANKVDVSAIRDVANRTANQPLKVLVIPQLGAKYQQNGKELRGVYAEWLFRQPLKMQNGTVIVLTKRGIAAFNPNVPRAELGQLGVDAAKLATSNSFTPAIVSLAEKTASAADAKSPSAASPAPIDASTTAAKPEKKGTSNIWLFLGFLGLGGLGFWLVKRGQAQQKLRAPLVAANEEIINGISYLDSYDDLLPDAASNRSLRSHREAANDAWSAQTGLISRVKSAIDAEPIRRQFEVALREINEGKNVIAASTGGTQTAFVLPDSLQAVDQARSPLFDPRPGVCYFTGMPSDQLQPVEIAINGQRRTVMASPQAIYNLQSGQPPQIAGDQVQGQFLPWYRVPGYNPGYGPQTYGGFGSGSFFSDMLMFSAISSAFNGWNHSGYQSGDNITINNYGDSQSAGDGQFDTGGSFDAGSFDTGGDFGGGDFGGGDFGGGDFGGGDFGG
jgi:hypothetical protein